MKKQFRNLLYVVSLVVTCTVVIIACSENSDSNNSNNDKQLSVRSRESSPAYLDQIPFVTASDTIVDGSFVLDHYFYENVEDSNVSWTYFDNLYSNSLDNSIKQKISYVVLCKKDLIGLVYDNPSDSALSTALKKHVDNLVNTKYLGYTALYYALDALNETGKETTYVKNVAAEIALYAAEDEFHPEMINAGSSEVGAQLYGQIEDNYTHISKIATFE